MPAFWVRPSPEKHQNNLGWLKPAKDVDKTVRAGMGVGRKPGNSGPGSEWGKEALGLIILLG